MGQYVFAVTFLLSAIIVIRAVVDFLVQISQLRTRQLRIKHELVSRRAEVPQKRAQVEMLKDALPPLKREYHTMRTYFNNVRDIELAAEREKEERTEEEEEEAQPQKEVQIQHHRSRENQPPREIQRRKTGWENF